MKNLFLFLIFSVIRLITYSQIIYKDIEPDLNMIVQENGSSALIADSIDINQDSTFDLKFCLSYAYSFVSPHYDESFQFGFMLQDSGNQVATDSGPYCKLAPFNQSDTIGNQLSWSENSAGMVIDPVNHIECNRFPTERYVGFRIFRNDACYYGWLQLELGAQLMDVGEVSYAYAKIAGYAYNSVPEYGLLAGDTLSSVEIPNSLGNSLNSGIKLVIHEGLLTLICEESILDTRIFDISGRILHTGWNSQNSKVTIDCSGWRPGCYLIQVKRKSGLATAKLLLFK